MVFWTSKEKSCSQLGVSKLLPGSSMRWPGVSSWKRSFSGSEDGFRGDGVQACGFPGWGARPAPRKTRRGPDVDNVPTDSPAKKDSQPLRYVGLRLLKPQGLCSPTVAIAITMRW